MDREFTPGEIVTVKFDNMVSSNTYVVESDSGDTVLLYHPLFPDCLMRHAKTNLDLVSPNVKDSIERSLDFVKKNATFLDYDTLADHEALCVYFVVRRKLTPRQKSVLSNICGSIASIKLNNDIREAMELVTRNAAVLDDFNAMWYRNFGGLFSGRQPITSKKQRAAIFNIAGFVMAELGRPVATNGYN
jgi:hypothetical protein